MVRGIKGVRKREGTFFSTGSRFPGVEMRESSVFRNYDPGDPSMRIYIKNLSKQVTEEVWLATCMCAFLSMRELDNVALFFLQYH